MNTTTHPSTRISKIRSSHPLGDLLNVVETLHAAILKAKSGDPDDRAIAELVWFAARSQFEALAVLAKRLEVDVDDLTDALDDPDESPELAQRVNGLVRGLVRSL